MRNDDADDEVRVLNASYSGAGYRVSRLPDGGLRAEHEASRYRTDADSARGLRRSIIEHMTGTGIHGSPGGVSGK